MTIPDLTDQGLLPPGVHQCTLDDLHRRFGRFQRSDRRIQLFEKLEQFLDEASAVDFVVGVLIDGSFATAKDEPNDIDLVLVLEASHDFSAPLRPFEYNVISKKQVRRRYQFDLLVACEGADEYDRYVEFFSQVRNEPNQQKGILRLEL